MTSIVTSIATSIAISMTTSTMTRIATSITTSTITNIATSITISTTTSIVTNLLENWLSLIKVVGENILQIVEKNNSSSLWAVAEGEDKPHLPQQVLQPAL